jgi:hypothetical protein
MVTIEQIVEKLPVEVLTPEVPQTRTVVAGYASDLLSCVMTGAKQDYIWVTLQSHMNVVAVASLLSLPVVLITEGKRPDAGVIEKAVAEGIVLLLTEKNTYFAVSALAALGVLAEP